jgi:hypothetical protein
MADSYQSSSQNNPVLCRSIDVWEHHDDAVLRFRCFELLGTSKYWVQSCDYYRSEDGELTWKRHDKNFIELLLESSLDDIELFDSLEEAIYRHRAEFLVHFAG